MLAQDFARIYRANSVLTASPGQLVLMLYDGALGALGSAQEAFRLPPRNLQRYEIINRQLLKARRIIEELRRTLDFEAGGEIAPLLQRLYDYYNRRLHEANIRKDAEPVAEVERLLGELRNAWAEMLRHQGGAVPPVPAGLETAEASR